MRPAPRTALAIYLGAMFALLPVLPAVVRWSDARLGRWATLLPATAGAAAVAALLLVRLARSRRPFPLPHLALLGLAAGAWASWRWLVSSPVGAVHLPEYGVLAVLASRALGGAAPAPLAGGLAAAGIGLLDEAVQHFVPQRVFDLWDVALNAAAAALGALALAWWRWAGEAR